MSSGIQTLFASDLWREIVTEIDHSACDGCLLCILLNIWESLKNSKRRVSIAEFIPDIIEGLSDFIAPMLITTKFVTCRTRN